MTCIASSTAAGATSATQVEANVQAASWSLSEDDLSELGRLTV